jgi:hypothetical protein
VVAEVASREVACLAEEEALPAVVAASRAEAWEVDLAAEVPAAVVASLAEAREVDRAGEDSPRARRSVAHGLVHSPALEAEE